MYNASATCTAVLGTVCILYIVYAVYQYISGYVCLPACVRACVCVCIMPLLWRVCVACAYAVCLHACTPLRRHAYTPTRLYAYMPIRLHTTSVWPHTLVASGLIR